MNYKIDRAERETTEDLIKDFGAKPGITVEEVYKTSWNRFNTIEGSQVQIKSLNQLVNNDEFVYDYKNLPLALHFYLYEDLYTFAGKYRKPDDPFNGRIYFGRQHAHQRKPTFKGTHPHKIEDEVRKAVKYLSAYPSHSPLKSAVSFYQKFVFVHPFYDGNGRVARLIANIFLSGFQLTISWSEFDSKNKFIKKLNWCHKNKSDKSLTFLTNYIKEYTFHFKNLE